MYFECASVGLYNKSSFRAVVGERRRWADGACDLPSLHGSTPWIRRRCGKRAWSPTPPSSSPPPDQEMEPRPTQPGTVTARTAGDAASSGADGRAGYQ